MFYGVDIGISTKWRTMRFHAVLIAASIFFQCTFCHDCFTDYQRRALWFGNGFIKCMANFVYVVPVNRNHFPTPCSILHGCIFGTDQIALCGKLHIVGIIKHNQVVQAQVTCNTPDALRDFFLDGTVADISINFMLHHYRT